MVVKLGNREVELKYTFNSFKYMQEFSPTVLEEVEDKPFKIIPFLEILVMGAVNHNKKNRFTEDEVDEFLEEYFNDGDISELIETLMAELENSGFFKKLQQEQK